ncbi:hypothetical protein WMF42_09235 [Sorangium sp. So ce176]
MERAGVLREQRRHVVQDAPTPGSAVLRIRAVCSGLRGGESITPSMSATSRGIGGLAGLVLLDLVEDSSASSSSFGGPRTPPGGFKVDDGFVSMEGWVGHHSMLKRPSSKPAGSTLEHRSASSQHGFSDIANALTVCCGREAPTGTRARLARCTFASNAFLPDRRATPLMEYGEDDHRPLVFFTTEQEVDRIGEPLEQRAPDTTPPDIGELRREVADPAHDVP